MYFLSFPTGIGNLAEQPEASPSKTAVYTWVLDMWFHVIISS